MKAEKWSKLVLLGAALILFAEGMIAQTCTAPQGAGFRMPSAMPVWSKKTVQEKGVPLYTQNLLLPEWEADNLPFFCRIEHKWSKNKATAFKFRLGSVDYVDWLEGKSHFATFAP
ncbi:MAG: hypothetical protein IT270_20810 [Saprospiraceae bacterium]|nr:hypothetical protein [Saprospiraceae bacterium]